MPGSVPPVVQAAARRSAKVVFPSPGLPGTMVTFPKGIYGFHRDVYKRQAHALALGSLGFPVNHALQGVVCRGGFCGFFLPQAFLLGVGVFGYGCGPVSYTHLDVYKRQVYSNLLCTVMVSPL